MYKNTQLPKGHDNPLAEGKYHYIKTLSSIENFFKFL